MKRLTLLVMPLMTLSLLANCNKGGGDKPEKVEFMLSSEQPTTVVDKTATIYVDWKPTDHAIKFDSFTFTSEQVEVDNITFDKESEARPMPVTIGFDDYITEDISGTLSFAYEDTTTKTKNESSIEVTINKPEPTKKWYEYENWWNYCSNDNPISEATTEDIGKEVKVKVNNLDHKIRLIDVNHVNAEGEEPEAHCTFEFVNVITDEKYERVNVLWDLSNVNYDFSHSTLNEFLNGENDNDSNQSLLEMLPSGLKDSIKEVNKKVGIGTTYTANSYKTKLFPLAYDEICVDHKDYAPTGEGIIYQYYKNHPEKKDRIKRLVGSTEELGEYYWLRSPYTTVNNGACLVISEGTIVEGDVLDEYKATVAPAFCI